MTDNPVEDLLTHECWRLLRSASVGRLAVCIDSGPDIFPVNYVVDHGTLVFRTAAGTKLTATLTADAVAVEADGIEGNRAWSVVVKGRAKEVTGVHALVETFELPLSPWHEGPKHRFIRVTPLVVTGRAFTTAESTHWTHPLSGARRASPE